ncbi:MAG: hypothetical protein V1944_02400 [Candidatus Aenigmatarchaeota archaeon]
MNSQNLEEIRFIEEQLYEARQALFAAKTVREIKFIQSKINYLRTKAIQLNK